MMMLNQPIMNQPKEQLVHIQQMVPVGWFQWRLVMLPAALGEACSLVLESDDGSPHVLPAQHLVELGWCHGSGARGIAIPLGPGATKSGATKLEIMIVSAILLYKFI